MMSLSDCEDMTDRCELASDYGAKDTVLEYIEVHASNVPHLAQIAIVKIVTFHHLAKRAMHHGWLDIVKLLVTKYGYDPRQDNTGLLPLNRVAEKGHLELVQYLHERCNCNINTPGYRGATPLHEAASSGSVKVVEYLVEYGANTIATDDDGATPLQHACQSNSSNRNVPVIKHLLSIPAVRNYYIKESSCSSPLSSAAENDTAVYEQVQVPHHVGSFVNIFLLGNSGAGKTTLCQAINDRSRVNIETDGAYVQKVKLLTAGIVPNKLCNDESLGNVIMHDFAGQKEYYSSHAAVIENLLQNSGAVFVVVINLTQDLLQQVRLWSSVFKEYQQNLSSEFHLIVIGSHADEVRELKKLEQTLRGHILNELGDIRNSLFTLDCRVRSKDNLKSFIESLSHSCALIRSKQQAVSLYCIFLYYILEDQISGKRVCCTLEELMSLCNQSQQKGVPLPDDIVPLLKTLHSRSDADIMYLENEKGPAKSWIIFSREILLTEVNGILFAPSRLPEHRDIASNTGIVKSSTLHKVFQDHSEDKFQDYSVDMLIGFLKSMKLCEELSKTLLDVLHTNLEIRDENPFLDSDQLLFFPALIAKKRPQDIKVTRGESMIGWCLKFKSEYFSSIPFLHALLLNLAYDIDINLQSMESEDNPLIPSGVERQCSIWDIGIHWCHDVDDIQTLVEVKDNMCVMLTSCPQNAEEMVRQHFKIVKKIKGLQQERFSSLKYEEYLLAPSDFQCVLGDQPSKVARYSMEGLKQEIRSKKNIIHSVNKLGSHVRISDLLPVEPAKKFLEIMGKPYSQTYHIAGNSCGVQSI